jgi:cytoskeleton protein RodZ
MSEEISVVENDTLDALPQHLGEQLRNARERLGLEVDEVARQLCLSARQVTALEADAFADLPSPTFTRGFIRNYAKLLQIDAEQLLAMYRSKVPDGPSQAAISLHTEGIPIQTGNRGSWLPYLVAAGILVLSAATWWFYMDWRESHPIVQNEVSADKPEPAATPVPLQTQSEPAPMGTGMQPEQLVEPASNPAPAQTESVPSASASPEAAVPVAPATQPQLQPPPQTPPAAASSVSAPPAPVAAAGMARVELKFTESSWVRVMDADGKELLNQTKPAASEEVVEGKPPLKLVIGNVNGATVIYKGQPVDVLSHAKANVARLTLE